MPSDNDPTERLDRRLLPAEDDFDDSAEYRLPERGSEDTDLVDLKARPKSRLPLVIAALVLLGTGLAILAWWR